jgi:N-methylhydantoinase B
MNPGTERERVAGGFYRPVQEDDVLENNSGGGGGWGDPFERDPLMVLADVRAGYVTLEGARHDYGVAIDTEDWTIDEEETARLRAGERPPERPVIGGETPGLRPLVLR